MTSRRLFLAILVVYLLLAAGFSVTVPLGEAPDEADHYAYARYLAQHRALPVGPTVTQGKHPPLYHGLAALLGGWTGMGFDFLRANPDAFPLGPDAPPNFFVHTRLEAFPWRDGPLALHLARFLSVLLGGVTLWATWRLGQESFPEKPAIGLLGAAFLAGLPGFLFISGAMNNDNAAGAFGGLALWLLVASVRRGLSWRRSGLLGLVLGLGLLSKVGTLALWPLTGLAVLGGLWPQRTRRQAWIIGAGHLALTVGLGLAVASPWLLRNVRLYGDPLGWALVRQTVDQRTAPLTWEDYRWLARGLYHYFWGRFGPIGQIWLPRWAYTVAGLASLALLAGILRTLSRQRPFTPQTRFVLAILALAPILVVASIVRYSAIALGTDQARLMWPGIAALAVWVGAGVAGLLDGTVQGRSWGLEKMVGGFLLFMAGVGLAALLLVVRPAFAPPRPEEPARFAQVAPLARFGEGLELLAAELPQDPLPLGQPLPLTLYWRAATPLAQDLRPVVRLVHQDGWLAAERDHSPAQGRYATDRWPPGAILADPYRLAPDPASPGLYRVLVGVRPFQGEWLPVQPPGEGGFLEVGRVRYR